MATQVAIVDEYARNSRNKLLFNETEMPSQEARFAFALIEKWGLVAAIPDGEDSAGRAKLRLPTPEELICRAFDMAAAAYAEMRKREMAIECPDISELTKDKPD